MGTETKTKEQTPAISLSTPLGFKTAASLYKGGGVYLQIHVNCIYYPT